MSLQLDGRNTPLIKIGDLDVWPIIDGRFSFAEPPGVPARESDEFELHERFITDDHLLVLDIGGFLVRSGDRLVLIDAGAGQGNGERFAPKPFSGLDDADPVIGEYFRERGIVDPDQIKRVLDGVIKTDIVSGSFDANLAAAGFRPEDVTDVVLSHLHFDHIGWVSVGEEAFFPNATYRVERADVEFFLDSQHDDRLYTVLWNAMPTIERMRPVLDRLEPWDDHLSLTPSIECSKAGGHTPGSSTVVLSSRNERAMVVGDIVHCPAELLQPGFSIGGGDYDRPTVDRVRAMVRREMEETGLKVSSPHFPGLRFGRLVAGEGRRIWAWDS
jgi:glyoxylase-like metal-dependent hydrolase (beta-lactamase superfamily II)